MNVNFYSCSDDKRKVNKNLSPLNSISCNIKEKSSLTNPTLILSKSSFSSISKCNYCYISEFGRYYYIEDVVLMTSERVEISCKVDVLMTFSGGIRGLTCVIDRQENLNNPYIVDSKIPVRSERIITHKTIGELTGTAIYLTVTNG